MRWGMHALGLIGFGTFVLFSASGCSSSAKITPLLHDLLQSSQTHSPNSTWWGYSQSKVVRDGESVYFGVIENDTGMATPVADFNLYEVTAAGRVLRGTHPSSRPGNVLVDPLGGVHVLVFEPFDAGVNDSVGSLVHYAYPAARDGDFANPTRTTVRAAPDATTETVNIRIGATVSDEGTLAVAYGLNGLAGHEGKVVVLHTRAPDGLWQHAVLEDVGHEYYYPFVVHTDSRVMVMPVQDDYVPGPPVYNRYYKVPFFTYDGVSWTSDLFLDLSQDPLAIDDTKTGLVEQSELFERTDGTTIAVYKDHRSGTRFFSRTITAEGEPSAAEELEWAAGESMNWVRAFEIDGELFFFGCSWAEAFLVRASDGRVVEVDLPDFPFGTYPYLSSHRGGEVRNASEWVDLLAVTGDSAQYPSPGMHLYRMPKSAIGELF